MLLWFVVNQILCHSGRPYGRPFSYPRQWMTENQFACAVAAGVLFATACIIVAVVWGRR